MKVSLNAKLKPFSKPKRYKVAFGGRGSSKSWTIARLLLLKAMENQIRILCVREIQDSIKDSVHKLLSDQIDLLELQGFTVQNDVIRHSNGSEFLFKGLYTNLSKIKSLEGVDICWIEEAESISAMSWEVIDPTIRKPNSEIWISFNPRFTDDIIYKTFLVDGKDNADVIKVNWQDNKYFPKELETQKDQMKAKDPNKYLHIWEGELKKNTEEQIMRNVWCIEDFKSNPRITDYYYGADWGFSQDPNTINRVHIGSHEKHGSNCLYIEYEVNDRAYGEDKKETSTDLNALPALWDKMPLIREHKVIADCARPETITHMRSSGFIVAGSIKGAGSIEDGIEHIRGYDKVIIHSRCTNTIHEFGNYKYKVDSKSGQVTNKILDKNNHHMDAIRYSLESHMKKQVINYEDLL